MTPAEGMIGVLFLMLLAAMLAALSIDGESEP